MSRITVTASATAECDRCHATVTLAELRNPSEASFTSLFGCALAEDWSDLTVETRSIMQTVRICPECREQFRKWWYRNSHAEILRASGMGRRTSENVDHPGVALEDDDGVPDRTDAEDAA